jgi:phosphoribosylanthranilate isomerase
MEACRGSCGQQLVGAIDSRRHVSPTPWIKICGICRIEDAELALDAGADALGLSFVPSSPRRVTVETARAVVERCGARSEIIGVIADLPLEQAFALRAELGLSALQLHGHESAAELDALLPDAYKAVRVGRPEDVEIALGFAGERVLVDACVPGLLGGTGVRAEPELCRQIARRRRVILAGGLTPENVARALHEVEPWGIDVASGVEEPGEPRRKSARRVRDFIAAARRAR